MPHCREEFTRYGVNVMLRAGTQIGPVKVGSEHKIALQTMTTTDTRDVEGTVDQVHFHVTHGSAACNAHTQVAGNPAVMLLVCAPVASLKCGSPDNRSIAADAGERISRCAVRSSSQCMDKLASADGLFAWSCR